jgi:uncharacterized protein YbaP (TraB family)
MIGVTRGVPEIGDLGGGAVEFRDSSFARRLAGVLAAALLACAGPAPDAVGPQQPASGATPALWHANAPGAGGGSLYLLGSVHMGTRRMLDLGPLVEEAYRRSDEIVVEVDVTRLEPEEMVALIQRHAELPAPGTLRDVLSPPVLGQLEAYLAERGTPLAKVERFKPWFVSFVVAQLELQRAGYEVSLGVDHVLMKRASAEKPIVALETVASQLQMLDLLPPPLQELMLKDILARVDRFADEVAELVEAWKAGDEARLEDLVFSPLARFPELEVFYDLVFFQRNERMAARLADLLGDGKTRLVVLGAGHMLGGRGIPTQLSERGYRVRRLEVLGGS